MTVTGSRRAIVLGALVLAAATRAESLASASGLSVEATLTPDRISAGEAATLTVVVRAGGINVPEPPAPRTAGLTFDPAGTAQNFSMIQGRVERSVTVAYRVRADRPGRYVIPPLRVSQGSETAESAPLTLTVLPIGSAMPREPSAGGGGPPEVYARLVVDKDRAYWNEAILARLRIYARVPLEGAPDWTVPETQGFWVEDLGAPTAASARVGGYVYVLNEIRWALFPTKTGRLRIGPARVRCRINRPIPPPDPWSALGLPDVRPEDVTLETDPVPITVEEVPGGAPEGYSGAVGSYALSVRVDRGTVPAGESAILTTVVRGEGNIASVRDPEVTAPPSVRRYVAASSTRIDRSGPALRGLRTQQVAIQSESPGTILVDPVRFVWFDPSDGRFHSVTSESIRIRVTAAPEPGPATARGGRAPGPAASPRTATGPVGPLSLGPPPGALALSGLALAGYSAWALLAVLRARRARDPRAVRRAALEAAAEGVAAARRRLAPGNAESSAFRAAEALSAGLAARFDVSTTGLPRDELLAEAGRRGAPDAAREQVGEILTALDAIAFAPPEARTADAAREMQAAEGLLARWRKELSA